MTANEPKNNIKSTSEIPVGKQLEQLRSDVSELARQLEQVWDYLEKINQYLKSNDNSQQP